MKAVAPPIGSSALATLRRFAQPRAVKEHCGLCGLALPPRHRHLLEMANRQIVCSCDPCALRFQDVVESRFKLIPRESKVLADFLITDQQWDDLALPINLAFFFWNSAEDKVNAIYPGAAGATTSLLPLAAWRSLVARNPALSRLEPDVEALLVNRVGTAREAFVVPIDTCFELVGLIRLHWRGFSGGETVWKEIDSFFAKLKTEARRENFAVKEVPGA